MSIGSTHPNLSNWVQAASIATRAMMVREAGSGEVWGNSKSFLGLLKENIWKHVCSVECLGTYFPGQRIFETIILQTDDDQIWSDYLLECYRVIPCYSFISGWKTNFGYFSEHSFPKHQICVWKMAKWFRMLLLHIQGAVRWWLAAQLSAGRFCTNAIPTQEENRANLHVDIP